MKALSNDYLPFASLSLVMLALLAHLQLSAVPQTIVDSSAPDTQFSGERAHELLLELLPDNEPHPAGSIANQAVRDRIIDWLVRHGITAEVSAAWGCHTDRGRCAWAENIIARIPGSSDEPYIALMAHYDSVDASPGAGDNLASVAIIMEIGRMIAAQQNHQKPVLLIFTDAEEDGRAGAEALFSQHPISKEIGLVLNMEGTGSEGESLLFRAANGNSAIVRSYAQNAAYPRGTSLGEELIKILPSDTDLSVVNSVGITGAEFGFTGFGKHTYHTPRDNTDNISLATIQNHGENLYGLVSSLLNQKLDAISQNGDLAYENFYGTFLVWPLWINYLALGLSLLLLSVASYRIEPKRRLLAQFFVPLLILVTTIAIMVPTVFGLHFLRGETPLRPPFPIPYLMLTFGLPIFSIMLHASWLNNRWQLVALLTGITWFWFVISTLLAVIAPKAAYIFLIPALTMSALLVVRQSFTQRNDVLILLFITLVPVSIAKGMQLLAWQHYWFSFMSLPFSILLASYLVPFLRGAYAKPLALSVLFVFMAAALATLVLPTYSSEHPQRGNLKLIEDFDTQQSWLRFDSVNPVPEELSQVRQLDSIAAIFPWGDKEITQLSAVERKVESHAEIQSSTEFTDQGRLVNISITNSERPVTTGLVIPEDSGLTHFVFDGVSYSISPAWWFDWQGNYVLDLRGVQNKTVDAQLVFDNASTVEAHLFEIYPGLPSGFEKEIEARNLKAEPVHDGDQHKVIRRISF